ncbi:MAG TPA: DUF4912 domain-containing protein [Polyangiaceae bacterium]|nr:DUF4912 domain-containing protein [Polyangiaceae bacterium]
MVSEPSLVSKLEPSPITESAPRRNLPHSRQIPWGYGRDRLTAIAIDPDRMFLYWEVRDETLDAGRQRLGSAGVRAALVLRIYDTSGRIFDGDNAHSFFDQDVQRSDRQWFCSVGKPASSAHVELGLRSPDGRFLKLVRSGRVDFPRGTQAPWQPPEWMRVVAHTGDIVSRETPYVPASGGGKGAPSPHGSNGAEAPNGGGHHGSFGGTTTVDGFESIEYDSYEVRQFDFERYETDTGWQVDPTDPSAVYRMVTLSWQEVGMGVTSWESGPSESSWQAGPFGYPTEVIVPAVERYEGAPQVYRSGEQVRVLHGPWQVVIRGINAHHSRRQLARWEVHRSWVSVASRGGEGLALGVVAPDGRVAVGASERFMAASELRLRGASEVFFLGASERRLGGASETRFLAASQWIARGASERLLKGASEWRLMGASETRLKGASERRLAGASERHFTGASERRLRKGASEQRLGGASEARLGGASEARIVDISSFPSAPSRKG